VQKLIQVMRHGKVIPFPRWASLTKKGKPTFSHKTASRHYWSEWQRKTARQENTFTLVSEHTYIKINSVAFSPQANYTDWATATCWRNLVPTFGDRWMSRSQRGGFLTVVNLSFLDRSRYFEDGDSS
jgi:hypothetical protein